jgi:hypothetical protein
VKKKHEPERTDEYEAFEKLARRLVKVPKSEVDAERAKDAAKASPSTRRK